MLDSLDFAKNYSALAIGFFELKKIFVLFIFNFYDNQLFLSPS